MAFLLNKHISLQIVNEEKVADNIDNKVVRYKLPLLNDPPQNLSSLQFSLRLVSSGTLLLCMILLAWKYTKL